MASFSDPLLEYKRSLDKDPNPSPNDDTVVVPLSLSMPTSISSSSSPRQQRSSRSRSRSRSPFPLVSASSMSLMPPPPPIDKWRPCICDNWTPPKDHLTSASKAAEWDEVGSFVHTYFVETGDAKDRLHAKDDVGRVWEMFRANLPESSKAKHLDWSRFAPYFHRRFCKAMSRDHKYYYLGLISKDTHDSKNDHEDQHSSSSSSSSDDTLSMSLFPSTSTLPMPPSELDEKFKQDDKECLRFGFTSDKMDLWVDMHLTMTKCPVGMAQQQLRHLMEVCNKAASVHQLDRSRQEPDAAPPPTSQALHMATSLPQSEKDDVIMSDVGDKGGCGSGSGDVKQGHSSSLLKDDDHPQQYHQAGGKVKSVAKKATTASLAMVELQQPKTCTLGDSKSAIRGGVFTSSGSSNAVSSSSLSRAASQTILLCFDDVMDYFTAGMKEDVRCVILKRMQGQQTCVLFREQMAQVSSSGFPQLQPEATVPSSSFSSSSSSSSMAMEIKTKKRKRGRPVQLRFIAADALFQLIYYMHSKLPPYANEVDSIFTISSVASSSSSSSSAATTGSPLFFVQTTARARDLQEGIRRGQQVLDTVFATWPITSASSSLASEVKQQAAEKDGDDDESSESSSEENDSEHDDDDGDNEDSKQDPTTGTTTTTSNEEPPTKRLRTE